MRLTRIDERHQIPMHAYGSVLDTAFYRADTASDTYGYRRHVQRGYPR